MITRRHFFKRLGMIAGCAVIAPQISIERLKYADFTPGQRLRNACRYPVTQSDSIAKSKLMGWLKTKVPPGFRYGKSPKFVTKLFDFDTQKGMAIGYDSPKQYRRNS